MVAINNSSMVDYLGDASMDLVWASFGEGPLRDLRRELEMKTGNNMQIATASKTLQGGNDYGAWDLVPIIMHGGSDYDDCGNGHGGVPP